MYRYLAAVLKNDGQIDAADEAIDAGLVALPGDVALEMAKISLKMARASGGGKSGEL